jgi:hypothetical protein
VCKVGFAKSFGDAPRCWASSSSFEWGDRGRWILLCLSLGAVSEDCDHCANICHFPNIRSAQSSSNGSRAPTSDQTSSMRCFKWKNEMFAHRIKSPQCPKCGAMMSLRIIESERPGFD